MVPLAEQISQCLSQYPHIQKFWVAYSGGVDSHVLLHEIHRLNTAGSGNIAAANVAAIHVNHGLSKDSQQWQEHCAEICNAYKIPLKIVAVNAEVLAGESPEEKARRVRYQVFEELVEENQCLLMAHHQDDQAETLMLQLLRGSGTKGLSAMPVLKAFSKGCLVRPMLTITQQQIMQYAQHWQLQWVEDESNANSDFDRNFLRQQVFPLLKTRYPSLTKTLSRTAQLCAESNEILDADAYQAWTAAVQEDKSILSMAALKSLSLARLNNVLRFWIYHLGFQLPSQAVLQSIVKDVVFSAAEASPLVHWQGAEIRRYRDQLFLMTPMPKLPDDAIWHWNAQSRLSIANLGEFEITEMNSASENKKNIGTPLNAEYVYSDDVSIRLRKGGEKCHPTGRGHEHSLKKIFQELAVPPWQRDRIPLMYWQEQIMAVGNYFVCEPFVAKGPQIGVFLSWKR